MYKQFFLSFVFLTAVASAAQSTSIAGTWRGTWTDPAGFVSTAELTLNTGPGCATCTASGDGSVQGKIVWTLRKVPANSTVKYAGKIGLTSTEFVKGESKGDGLLILNGYAKDDPQNIIAMDKYRLVISDDGRVIGGITYSGGPWTGQFIAER